MHTITEFIHCLLLSVFSCNSTCVGINIFEYLFSMGMLMIYNNNYTPYKINVNVYGYFVWLFFLMFSFVVNHHYVGVALFLFTITLFNSATSGSLWCWTINFSMIFYAF